MYGWFYLIRLIHLNRRKIFITACVAKRAKVMFSQASVMLSLNRGEGARWHQNASWDRSNGHRGVGGCLPPPRTGSKVKGHPPPPPGRVRGQAPPWPGSKVTHLLPLGYIRVLRSMGRRYTSYWNALLFWKKIGKFVLFEFVAAALICLAVKVFLHCTSLLVIILQ